jgi:hypothetical protein
VHRKESQCNKTQITGQGVRHEDKGKEEIRNQTTGLMTVSPLGKGRNVDADSP